MGSVIFVRTGHDDDPCPTAEECSFRIPLLFFVYCTVDYTTYAMGLYVIQRGGANLMVLTSAIAVPLQQMAFALHFVLPGKLYQPVVYTDRAPRTAPALAPFWTEPHRLTVVAAVRQLWRWCCAYRASRCIRSSTSRPRRDRGEYMSAHRHLPRASGGRSS